MQRIGRYEVVGELGRGAMGVVYKAQDPAIGRTVAIKTIRLSDFSDPAENSRLRDRLFREAQSAGILSHPGIVTIYDIAEEGGFAYIFMEYVSGPTLESVLGSPTPPGPQEVLNILRQVAAALDYAHKKGIVHRDIKPANIMIHEDGTPKIADFGVAKMLSQNMTQAGAIMGTPNYMAPEQVQGKPVDGRADQFSLAVITYEIITGEKPFAAESLPTLLFKLVAEEPPLPHRINPSLPKEINPVILRAMSKSAEGRFSTCSEFIAALETAFVNQPDWQPIPAGTSQSIPTAASPTNAPQTGEHKVQPPSPPRVPPPAPPLANTPPTGITRQVVAPPPVAAPPPPPPPPAQVAAQPQFVPVPPPPTRVQPPAQQKKSGASKTIVAAVFSLVVIGGLIFLLVYLMDHKRAATDPAKVTDPPPIAEEGQKKPEEPPKPSAVGEPARETKPAATVEPSVRREPAATNSKPAEAVKQGAGYVVRINTNPAGAKIVFDQAQSCTAPCIYELPAGRHSLSADLSGYGTASRIFELPRDSNVTIEMRKPTGLFKVTTNPAGATLYIDGLPQPEKTPCTVTIPAGSHRIRLVKEGYKPTEDTINIEDGSTLRQNYSWE